MAIVDIVVIAVLALFGIVGLKKGFAKQAGKLIVIVAAIGAAVFLFKMVAEYAYKLDFVISLEGKLLAKLQGIEAFNKNANEGKEVIAAALTSIKIPGVVQDLLFKLIDFENLPDKTLAVFLAPLIVQYACYAASFLGIFIVAWIIASIIVKAITKAVDVVPGAGFIDKLLGMAFSAGIVVLIIWALLYGLTFLSFMPKIYDTVNNFIETYTADSIVAKFIIEHNGVTWLVGKFLTM